MCCGCWLQAGGGGFQKWPPSFILTGRVIRFYTVTQGKVHCAPQLVPFGGVSPWKRQQKLNIWSSPCGARNEHQMKHCTLMQRCGAKAKHQGCETNDTFKMLIKCELLPLPWLNDPTQIYNVLSAPTIILICAKCINGSKKNSQTYCFSFHL
ncbi:hypothetical protein ILYODFUR_029219 [Ilyodon furcidens]|uniref:Uncharacterized protein n=1 Tax=Ilyodon furcidens TaxID=33524 RepID=A0ABV0TEY6_9TELE